MLTCMCVRAMRTLDVQCRVDPSSVLLVQLPSPASNIWRFITALILGRGRTSVIFVSNASPRSPASTFTNAHIQVCLTVCLSVREARTYIHAYVILSVSWRFFVNLKCLLKNLPYKYMCFIMKISLYIEYIQDTDIQLIDIRHTPYFCLNSEYECYT